MNLYLISQNANNNYDTYDSAVVAAENEDLARQTHPEGDNSAWNENHRTWCKEPRKVNVRLLGKAAPNTEAGVILASFNAG